MFLNLPAVPVVVIVGAFATGVLCVGIYFAYCALRTAQETALKREMIERGFSAAEIVAVISAHKTPAGAESLDNSSTSVIGETARASQA